MAPSANKGFYRLIKAAQFSRQGMQSAYQHEEAFRQEVWLAVVLIPLGLYLGDNGVEKTLLVGSVFVGFAVDSGLGTCAVWIDLWLITSLTITSLQ